MSAITTMSPADAPAGPEWLPSPPYRLTLEQYERMVNEGIIGEHDRVHLINGILVAKMTQNDPHCTADDLCDAALRRVIPAGWYIRGAKPIRIPGRAGRRDSKPEPDRCVVRGTVRDYEERTPGPSDVGLVVEIADTSLTEDRKYATDLYGPADPGLLDRQPGGPPGGGVYEAGATWLPLDRDLQRGAVRPGRDRRPGSRPNRRRGHPAVASTSGEGRWGRSLTTGQPKGGGGQSH